MTKKRVSNLFMAADLANVTPDVAADVVPLTCHCTNAVVLD